MLRCTGCGNTLAANARFCSLCGKEAVPPSPTAMGSGTTRLPGAPPHPPAAYPTQYPPQQPTVHGAPPTYDQPGGNKKKIAIAAGIGAVTAAIALVLILRASGVLGARPTEVSGGAVLTPPETRPVAAPVLTPPQVDPPKAEAPVLAPPATRDNPMPEDVVAYLRWLKRFDEARRKLETKAVAAWMQVPVMITTQMMNEFDENNAGQPKPRNRAAEEVGLVVQQMNDATGKFPGYPPPNPCVPLAQSYMASLSNKTRQLAQMQTVLTSVFQAINDAGNSNSQAQELLPKLLAEMQNKTMSREADAADAAATASLNALRSQYTSMPADVRDFDFRPVDTNLDPHTIMPPGLGMGL